jgi:hypothetical protein
VRIERNEPVSVVLPVGMLVFKTAPLLVGGLAIWLGYKLFLAGVGGTASLAIDAKDLKGQLVNAAPGVFFAVGGVVIVVAAIWKGLVIEIKDGHGSQRVPS